jgi:hypothetical protein
MRDYVVLMQYKGTAGKFTALFQNDATVGLA